ncbi:hypothetical protein IE53DRAFT_370407 [Violaceomyces palustris]|uniref:Uncharacterized protein n=1 Tax=Violaceomyces palustris TaxID=1673888 RepID=A0ACD0NS78_9BASI|nr:hypothetical protein IE53DRAFT_370407 [Violaceomyces palustris]
MDQVKQGTAADAARARLLSRNDLRDRIMKMRQAKQDELRNQAASASVASSSQPSASANPTQDVTHVDARRGLDLQSYDLNDPRHLSWYGVEEEDDYDEDDDDYSDGGLRDRGSDDDAESTVLGHNLTAVRVPSPRMAAHELLAASAAVPPEESQDPSLRPQPPPFSSGSSCEAGEDTLGITSTDEGSGERSVSAAPASLDVGPSYVALRRLSGMPQSRRVSSRLERPGTSSSILSTESIRSKPNGPPPDLPLPIPPLNPARTPSIISQKSHRTSISNRSSSGPSRAGTPSMNAHRLTQDPPMSPGRRASSSSRNSESDRSSHRRFSANIPPPYPPPVDSLPPLPVSKASCLDGPRVGSPINVRPDSSMSQPGSCSSNLAGSSSDVSDEYPATPSRALSPLQASFSSFGARGEGRGVGILKDNSLFEGIDEVDDEALSDVIHMTPRQLGLKIVASPIRSPRSPFYSANIGSVGLGFRSALSPKTPPLASATPGSPATPGSLMVPSPKEDDEERRRKSLMRKSLGGLVAALDEEANRWSDVTGEQGLEGASDSAPSTPEPSTKCRPFYSSTLTTPKSQPKPFQPVVLHSSTAKPWPSNESSSGKESRAESRDEDAELASLFSAYQNSIFSIGKVINTPTVQVEDADAEVDSASSDGSEQHSSSTEDGPRKRRKQPRRYGFEDQRAAPSRVGSQRSLRPGDVAPHTSPTQLDPYAFYEFSPGLPPFVGAGLTPKDLTGTGTWSSIVARAGNVRSHHGSVASFSTVGPVSVRKIAADARAKKQEAEAARLARESQASFFSSLSYKPMDIHEHAKEHARLSGGGLSGCSSPAGSMFSSSLDSSFGRRANATCSVASFASSQMTELATKWPVAVDDTHDLRGSAVGAEVASKQSLVGLGIQARSQAQTQTPTEAKPAKVYAEVSMQTSPSSTPPTSPILMPQAGIQTSVPRSTLHRNASTYKSARKPSHGDPTDVDRADESEIDPFYTPRKGIIRRGSLASFKSSIHDVDLDEPGVWPSSLRAPRLSARKSTIGLVRRGSSTSLHAADEPSAGKAGCSRRASPLARDESDTEIPDSDSGSEESDLDVGSTLEMLAQRSGVLDEVRGSKRKLRQNQMEISVTESPSSVRQIKTIPQRSRSSKMLAKSSSSRPTSRSTGWSSSEGDEDEPRPGPSMVGRAKGRVSMPNSTSSNLAARSAIVRSLSSKSAVLHRTLGGGGSTRRRMTQTPPPTDRASSPELDLISRHYDSEDEDDDDNDLLNSEMHAPRFTSPALKKLDDAFDLSLVTPLKHRSSVRSLIRKTSPTKSVGGGGGDNMSPLSRLSLSRSNSATESVSTKAEPAMDLPCSPPRSERSGHGEECGMVPSSSHGEPDEEVEVIDVSRDKGAASSPERRGLVRSDDAETPERASRLSADLEDTPNTMAGSQLWSTVGGSDRNSSASSATAWSDSSLRELEGGNQEGNTDAKEEEGAKKSEGKVEAEVIDGHARAEAPGEEGEEIIAEQKRENVVNDKEERGKKEAEEEEEEEKSGGANPKQSVARITPSPCPSEDSASMGLNQPKGSLQRAFAATDLLAAAAAPHSDAESSDSQSVNKGCLSPPVRVPTLNRKASGLPTPSRIGRLRSSSIGRPSSSFDERQATSPLDKNTMPSIDTIMNLKAGHPSAQKQKPGSSEKENSSATKPARSASLGGTNQTPSKLRKMKSFSDRTLATTSSNVNRIPTPPISTLPRMAKRVAAGESATEPPPASSIPLKKSSGIPSAMVVTAVKRSGIPQASSASSSAAATLPSPSSFSRLAKSNLPSGKSAAGAVVRKASIPVLSSRRS